MLLTSLVWPRPAWKSRTVDRALFSTFLCCGLLLLPLRVEGVQTQELQRRTLTHDGRDRVYFVHFPGNQPPAAPKPTLLVLHGGGGASAAEMARRTGMNRIADREGFVVVYPAGVNGVWNDGRGASFRRARGNADVDDVGFIRRLIATLTERGEADPARVYVMGASNGGMMAYRLGIELGDQLAAIAAVIANLPVNLAHRKPVRPLPVLIMNGTDDPMMPWNGGPVRVWGREFGTVLSTERTVRYWTDAAHLPPGPTAPRVLEEGPRDDGCRVEVEVYREEGNPAEVILYRIRGGGHNLPGGDTPDRPLLLGRKCTDINAAEVIWAFFRQHALPHTPGVRTNTLGPPAGR
ncbi:MAG: PHB depolymerase family esterase [Armatimonadota bacterium]|nr:PHB depolymerase family esterase [Armatimonadota bacterium]